jgi:uncharacterized protein (DUF1800 family)
MKTIFFSAIISILTLIQPRLLIAAEIPSQLKALHVLNRLGFGPRPGDIERVNAMGVENYIHQQLFPETIQEPPALTQKLNALMTYSLDPNELFEEYGPPPRINGVRPDPDMVKAQRKKARIILQETIKARLMQAIESPRQLQEVMVDFWFNHFNVYAQKGLDHLWVGNYERQAIRPYVLGRFRDLLGATAHHPAMLFYLDNWQNVDPNSFRAGAQKSRGLNENYARELMELHTLGVNGGYTQDDVIVLARILTGWGFRGRIRGSSDVSYDFYFNNRRHDNNDKVFLGQTIEGGGQQEVETALDILARSPATAKHISYELAQYFVADDPDPALVEQLAQKFEDTDGDIRAVLQALFDSPPFWDEKNYGNKFKTPYQYIISMVRASGEDVTNFRPLIGMLQQLGMPLYECQTPDGYKNTQEAWLNPDGMLRRINFATALAFGRVNINDDQFPIPYEDLTAVYDDQFSPSTMQAIQGAPARLHAALVLGSPEMMKR